MSGFTERVRKGRLQAPDLTDLEAHLQALGFVPETGRQNIWTWSQGPTHYVIRCLLEKSRTAGAINYGNEIRRGRDTSCNFSQPENLVVLDCVCRLVSQGYPPSQLFLEKPYKVGHDDKFLDILVSKDDKAFLMIECKTWGGEFDREFSRLKANGGQLLSYFPQDRRAGILALYTAEIVRGQNAKSRYEALETTALAGDNLQEIFASWSRETFSTGLFEAGPYQFAERSLRVGDLEDMVAEDGGKIFNSFAEILRRHVISDKPNAFNKIFNLFICKVQDEEKLLENNEQLEFQWRADESSEAVLNRLGAIIVSCGWHQAEA